MLPRHVTLTAQGVYKYRRRTPQELKEYIEATEVIRSLGRDSAEALKKTAELNQAIEQALLLTKMTAVPATVLTALLEKYGLMPTKADQEEPNAISKGTLKDTATLYLQSLSVSKDEVRDRRYILLEVFPAVFEVLLKNPNPLMGDIKYTHLIKARDLLQQFPKRNIERYRRTPLKEIAKGLHSKTLTLSPEEQIGVTTLNKYLKWFSVLLSFAVKQNIIPSNPVSSGLTVKKSTVSRGERKEFSADELEIIDQAFQGEDIYPVVKILRYTGMRPSELLKCSMSEIEGVLCFDLRSPTKALKTLSSHRVIPVHPSLKESVEGFQKLLNSYAEKYISKRFAKVLHRHLEDTKNKSLYSLRHTFATNLIAKGVQPEIVSELMGHSHSTMTMNRYVKGYPIRVLKEAIETL